MNTILQFLEWSLGKSFWRAERDPGNICGWREEADTEL